MDQLIGFCDNLEFRMSIGHNAYRDNMYTEKKIIRIRKLFDDTIEQAKDTKIPSRYRKVALERKREWLEKNQVRKERPILIDTLKRR